MARWLITVTAPPDLRAVEAELRAVGGRLEELDPIPLDDGTAVVFAVGPPDLGNRAHRSAQMLAVHPNSDPMPFG